MDYIQVKETKIFLNLDTQISKLGRNFRLSGIAKNATLPPKWIEINKKPILKYHWIYTFRYLDVDSEFFEIEIDYNNNFVRLNKIKNE